MQYWQPKSEITLKQMLGWLNMSSSKYYSWRDRQGQANEHNGQIPKETWLLEWEKEAIKAYALKHAQEGYRRLSYMMVDEDKVAVSPSSVYRVLKQANRLQRWDTTPTHKGQGFVQPTKAHQHWHIDIAYLNIAGTFYYLCSILDGYSRYLVHWEIKLQMTEFEVELILQRAREKFPEARPRIISDNGPQFIARDFKHFIRDCGMTHVRTSPNYPQSNGKIERWHKTLKSEAIRPKTPLTLNDANRVVDHFVTHYNTIRLHSAIGYVSPLDRMTGKDQSIQNMRQQRLVKAKLQRQLFHSNSSLSYVSHSSQDSISR